VKLFALTGALCLLASPLFAADVPAAKSDGRGLAKLEIKPTPKGGDALALLMDKGAPKPKAKGCLCAGCECASGKVCGCKGVCGCENCPGQLKGKGKTLHVSPDGTVNELGADGVYRPVPGAAKQKPTTSAAPQYLPPPQSFNAFPQFAAPACKT
jgi:hypothetical protein